MAIIPPDWRLRAITDVPFCAPCWIEGQRLQGFAYVQGAWLHAGRISCPRHGDWLFSARDKLGRAHCDPEHGARHGVSVPAVRDMLDHHSKLESSGSRWWIADAGERLRHSRPPSLPLPPGTRRPTSNGDHSVLGTF
jgi:hypothetical protein